MVVGTRSRTKGKAAEHNHAEEDSDKHQTEEKEIGEAPEEEADKWSHQSWGVRIKKEIISESLGKQRDSGNKHNETGTIADPIKVTDKEGSEGLEKEQGKNDWLITPKLGNRTESPVSSSTSSKRRLQGVEGNQYFSSSFFNFILLDKKLH